MSQFVDNDGWEIQTAKAKPSREKNTAANWTLPSIDFIPPTTDPPNFQQFMLLLCGIPGSGKSTFARALERAMPYKFVRINQDELGNRKACEVKAREVLAEGKCPIIDRCNFDWSQRQKWTSMANNHDHELNTVPFPVDCILLQIPVEECIRRCEGRMFHETIQPHQARDIVCKVHRQYTPPSGNHEPNLYRSLSRVRDDHAFNDLLVECLSR